MNLTFVTCVAQKTIIEIVDDDDADREPLGPLSIEVFHNYGYATVVWEESEPSQPSRYMSSCVSPQYLRALAKACVHAAEIAEGAK